MCVHAWIASKRPKFLIVFRIASDILDVADAVYTRVSCSLDQKEWVKRQNRSTGAYKGESQHFLCHGFPAADQVSLPSNHLTVHILTHTMVTVPRDTLGFHVKFPSKLDSCGVSGQELTFQVCWQFSVKHLQQKHMRHELWLSKWQTFSQFWTKNITKTDRRNLIPYYFFFFNQLPKSHESQD